MSIHDSICVMDCILACVVLYMFMTCCKWRDRILPLFRLFLLSIVAHPFPSFPYLYVGPQLHLGRALHSLDVQRSIGLRIYLGYSFLLLWSVYTTCHFSLHVVYLQLYLDCKWVAIDCCGSTCFSYSVFISVWYYRHVFWGDNPSHAGMSALFIFCWL